jgi:hypothetical protein
MLYSMLLSDNLTRTYEALIAADSIRTIATMHMKEQPISTQIVMRIAVVLIVIFAILAGYYKSSLEIWRTNNIRILEKFNVWTTKELLEKKVEVQ